MVFSQKLGQIQSQHLDFMKVHSIFIKTAMLFARSTDEGTQRRPGHNLRRCCQLLEGLKGLMISQEKF